MTSERTIFSTCSFALVIVRHPSTGRYLCVDESEDRGWWIPGGGVDKGESFAEAAIRECREEAGVAINLLGVLKVDHCLSSKRDARMRVFFYAEPVGLDVNNSSSVFFSKESSNTNNSSKSNISGDNINDDNINITSDNIGGCRPKSIPDAESNGAAWLSLEEFMEKTKKRGLDTQEWGQYLENGGVIYPLTLLNEFYEGHVASTEQSKPMRINGKTGKLEHFY